jgi:hypothetical protein
MRIAEQMIPLFRVYRRWKCGREALSLSFDSCVRLIHVSEDSIRNDELLLYPNVQKIAFHKSDVNFRSLSPIIFDGEPQSHNGKKRSRTAAQSGTEYVSRSGLVASLFVF